MRKKTWRRGRPRGHEPMTAAERMRRMRARRKAAGFRPVVAWVPFDRRRPRVSLDVRLLEARSLALHVIAARKIESHPELLDIARRDFASWRDRDRAMPGETIRLWRKLLRLPWPDVAAVLTEQSARGIRLRGMSPFFGVLTPRERRQVYGAFRHPRGAFETPAAQAARAARDARLKGVVEGL